MDDYRRANWQHQRAIYGGGVAETSRGSRHHDGSDEGGVETLVSSQRPNYRRDIPCAGPSARIDGTMAQRSSSVP